ncbi:MAG: hypothetical protein CMJ80_12105 [Planctomycetaceae bacterium]|nr:hypothetical protein [Planctomycetaceae bacterium]
MLTDEPSHPTELFLSPAVEDSQNACQKRKNAFALSTNGRRESLLFLLDRLSTSIRSELKAKSRRFRQDRREGTKDRFCQEDSPKKMGDPSPFLDRLETIRRS